MKFLIQRVKSAQVNISGETVAEISSGLLAFVGVEKTDTKENANKLLEKVLNYRVFSDAEGKMNLNLQTFKGSLLLVSQFTLAADTQKGLRPSFSSEASPSEAKSLYEYVVEQAKKKHACYGKVVTGKFGADMQVSLINDGPVTFLLEG